MSFEPTEPQDGVDPNPFLLIDPEAIPYPLTDTWSLNYAAETLRTGGENLFSGAEDMHSTWAGLQAHYVAPESETLFAAMDPVVTRGEDIQSDLATVADALEELAEAASTARFALNGLRIEAQSLWNNNHDKKVWWLNKDEETDEWAFSENMRIKDGVNTAWATFNEAENACATRISTLFGGPSYASPDQADGGDVEVYGLPTDAGEREDMGFMDPTNDFTVWLGSEFHPSHMDIGNDTGQALWDVVVTDVLWGSAVGLATMGGNWHPDRGWQITPGGRWANIKDSWSEAGMSVMTLAGVHGAGGWLFSSRNNGGQAGEGSRWEQWKSNMGASWGEVWEGHTAWSTREDGVAYSNTTIGANAVMLTGGLPLKALKGVLSLFPDSPGSGGREETDGQDGQREPGHQGSGEWPSSPLPQHLQGGSIPIGERFQHDLTVLGESLLDPDRYRNTPTPQPETPSPTPNRPVVGDSGDQLSSVTPQRDDISQAQGGEGPSPNLPREEVQDAARPRPEDTDASGRLDQEPETPAPTTRPDTEGRRGDSDAPRAEDDPEQRPPRRDEDGGGDRGEERAPRGDEEREGTGGPREEPEAGRPDPATGGGGGDEPPDDRTGTGGGDDSSGDDDSGRDEPSDPNAQDPSPPPDPERERKLERASGLEERLRDAGLTDEEIARLRGEHPRDGDHWQRAASALNQGFGRRLDAQLHPAATRFALGGAADPREFAYRYEYYKATFDELSRSLQSEDLGRRQAQQQAAEQISGVDVAARLEADHAVVAEMRGGEPASVDTTLPPDDLEQAIRSQVNRIEMGHETATAYHARKHYNELPPGEQGGGVVSDYLTSAERTVRSGEVSEFTPLDGGAQKWTFIRPSVDSDGNQMYDRKNRPVYMRAFIIVRANGTLVMPTYGMATLG